MKRARGFCPALFLGVLSGSFFFSSGAGESGFGRVGEGLIMRLSSRLSQASARTNNSWQYILSSTQNVRFLSPHQEAWLKLASTIVRYTTAFYLAREICIT